MSKTVLCDNLKAGLDLFRPFPPEHWLHCLENVIHTDLCFLFILSLGSDQTVTHLNQHPHADFLTLALTVGTLPIKSRIGDDTIGE